MAVGIDFTLEGNWETRQVLVNGKVLDPARSQAVHNHSPDGFCWGYGGSGPAQLALALMMELFSKRMARDYYQTLKWKLIAAIPQRNFKLKANLVINDLTKTLSVQLIELN